MKILCLADLHLAYPGDSICKTNIGYLIGEHHPDVVVIAGDIFDYDPENPYEELAELVSKELPIVFCLGNHEFFYRSIPDVLDKYFNAYEPNKLNVHCLDVCYSRYIDEVNFVGNVLWYDGSMYPKGNMPEVVDSHWLDSTIKDFNWQEANANCVHHIKHSLLPDKINVLVTHCVPHAKLNIHPATSRMNGYSGMSNLFAKLEGYPKISWAVCGHTHRYCTAEIDGVFCVNVGNDYAFISGSRFKHFLIEV